ncbi:acylphosphatase [Mesobacillus foraminis]|uniref:acylphosphatase n=1 Tax=Mesobacillus foraminis TaxID=279826 RepID=UPI000EF48C39|nr:acylphosphatase [Mesobacillus foraminis]
MVQWQLIVKGRVQGVGFRYFTQMKAVQYGINGWVRNREDGSVEILASGNEEELNQFIADIRKGNPFSKVDHVDIQEAAGSECCHSFKIKY